jgi:hypothetical protein
MSYTKLIDKQLTLAFNKVKDLAVNAIVLKRTNGEFNFATGLIASGATTQIHVKAIVVDQEKSSKDVNTEVRQVMFKTQEVTEITLLDKIVINDVTWAFSNMLKSNGYVTVAEISKEK